MRKSKYTPPKMTKLQADQLKDLILAGHRPKISVPRELNKGFTDTPLFSQENQTKLF